MGSRIGHSEAGVTVAEMEMNSSPMISWTSVSKNGRRAGTSKPRRFADREAHQDRGDQPGVVADDVAVAAATPITVANCAGRAEHAVQPQRAQQQPQQRDADARRRPGPTAMLAANSTHRVPSRSGVGSWRWR